MWSAGCIVAEMLKRTPLLPGRDFKEQLRLIIGLARAHARKRTRAHAHTAQVEWKANREWCGDKSNMYIVFSIQSMTLVVNGLDPQTHCPPKSLNTTNGKKSRAPMPF